MTYKATNRRANANSSAVPIVLFGVDENGKPKAARFLDKHANLPTKAAAQLNLQVLQIIGPAASDLAPRLPQGRIHAYGRGFIPYIRRDLYSKLVAAAGGSVAGRRKRTPQSPVPRARPSNQPRKAIIRTFRRAGTA